MDVQRWDSHLIDAVVIYRYSDVIFKIFEYAEMDIFSVFKYSSFLIIYIDIDICVLEKKIGGLSGLVQMFIHKTSTFRPKFWSLSRL